MRPFVYWSCFLVVALATAVELSLIAMNLLRAQSFPPVQVMTLASLLGRPTPFPLRALLPSILNSALAYLLWALVLRRMWLVFRQKVFTPPASLSGPLALLTFIVAVSLWLGAIAMAVTAALGPSSFVVASLISKPAALLAALTVFLVELFSLVRRRRLTTAKA